MLFLVLWFILFVNLATPLSVLINFFVSSLGAASGRPELSV